MDWTRAPAGEIVRTFAILTTTATATMRHLHERMPVIIEPDAWSTWLSLFNGPAMDLMRPADDHVLHFWPVSPVVNSVRSNWAELLDRVTDPSD